MSLKPKGHRERGYLHVGKTILILPKVAEAYKVQARAAIVNSIQGNFAFQQSILYRSSQTSRIKERGRDNSVTRRQADIKFRL